MATARVKLLGTWASSYTHRVQLALNLKGVEFEYIEEDLSNKSPFLLQCNPIHKKVPVLLHDDRPIVESAIILEYIDETWNDHFPIMPHDPFERSIVRFWCRFTDEKLGPAIGNVFKLKGEDQKVAVHQSVCHLKLLEDALQDGFFKGRRFFGGENIGFLDIIVGCGSYWIWVLEELAQVKLVDPIMLPRFHSWLKDFELVTQVKEIIPPTHRLLEYAKGIRKFMMVNEEAD